jgi:hypothetical protein
MPVITRSQTKKATSTPAKVPLNAKGHPSVGMLTVKKPVKKVIQPIKFNPFIEQCTSVEDTTRVLKELDDMIEYIEVRGKIDSDDYVMWRDEIRCIFKL